MFLFKVFGYRLVLLLLCVDNICVEDYFKGVVGLFRKLRKKCVMEYILCSILIREILSYIIRSRVYIVVES